MKKVTVRTAGDQNREIILAVLQTLVNQASTGNKTKNPNHLVSAGPPPPYRRLLQSAGATEGLFYLKGYW